MAYPFTQIPTFLELKDRLVSEYDCAISELEEQVNGDDHTIFYVERSINGTTKKCVIDKLDDSERITYSVIRTICTRLDIDPSDFGLPLGFV